MSQQIYDISAGFQWGNGANCCVCVISNLGVQAGTGKEILLRFVTQKYPKILEIADVRQAGPNFVLFSENAWRFQGYETEGTKTVQYAGDPRTYIQQQYKTNEIGGYISRLTGPDEFGGKFADAIEEAGVGEVYRSPKVQNYLHTERFNHPPGDRVFIWTVDHAALREWYRENQEKPVENVWETIGAQVAEADKVQAARAVKVAVNVAQSVYKQVPRSNRLNREIQEFLRADNVFYQKIKEAG